MCKYITNSLVIAGLSITAITANAQNNGYSHGYINRTRYGDVWLMEQQYAVGQSKGNTDTTSSSIGQEFFGFFTTSIVTSIRHRYLDLPTREFAVGRCIGIQSKAVFESPLVNIEFFGSGNGNFYTVPSLDNYKTTGIHTYAGVQLSRFWTYRVSLGIFARQGVEKFKEETNSSLLTQEAGLSLGFWDR